MKPLLLNIMHGGERFTKACQMLGLNKSTPWRWRQTDPDFNALFVAASVTIKYRRLRDSFEQLQQSFYESPASGDIAEVV